jgi:TRAP-type C4-dicarboxylate transport system substrate-binding protein
MAKSVERASNGRIKIQLFSGGELVSPANMLKGVQSGMIDMAQGCGAYYSELAIGEIEGGMPMAWMSPLEAQIIYDEMGLGKVVAEEYAKFDVVWLGTMWAAPYQILSKEPRSLDDLRKMKIRAIATFGKMFQGLGVSTVSMAPEEIYLALSTGQINAVLYGAAYEYQLNKYFEVAPYFLETPMLNPFVDSIIINKKVWDSMPADLQEILKMAVEMARFAWYIHCEYLGAEARATIFKEVTSLSLADQAELTKAAVAAWEEEAAKSEVNAKAVEIIKTFAKRVGRI